MKTKDQSGVAGWGWAAACHLMTDGVRMQQGALVVADALIRANAVDVLQQGKNRIRLTPDKDQINSRQAGARQDWILR